MTARSTILVTGAAGFIGMLVCARLLRDGHPVIGVDCLTDYYPVTLKHARLAHLTELAQRLGGAGGATSPFTFVQADVADHYAIGQLFKRYAPRKVVHLAAQAGVRYALDHPLAYASCNLTAMTVILEHCRHHRIEHLVMASSSSVYGGSRRVPFRESDPADHPVSFYAATKRADEMMAHSYAHLFGLPITALRYFTVYGPWGRPDMAVWKFTDAILQDRPIDVYAGGRLSRDFTFGEDTADATVRVLDRPPQRPAGDSTDPASWQASGPDSSWAPFETYNVGRSDPVSVNELIGLIERAAGRSAIRQELPMQPGDVERTAASTDKLRQATGFEPRMPLAQGIEQFVAWRLAHPDVLGNAWSPATIPTEPA